MYERNPYEPCPYMCGNKSSSGWCNSTACINPKYNGYSKTIVVDETEYSIVQNCPKCGRPFTENMVCECGENNASIRL